MALRVICIYTNVNFYGNVDGQVKAKNSFQCVIIITAEERTTSLSNDRAYLRIWVNGVSPTVSLILVRPYDACFFLMLLMIGAFDERVHVAI